MSFGGTALDYLADLGASAEIDIGKHLGIEPGIDWRRIFYGATSLDVGSVFVRAAVRLGQ